MRRFVQFTLVGGVITLLHFILLIVLIEFVGLSGTLSTSIGFLCGAVVQFQLGQKWVFQYRGRSSRALLKFIIMVASGCALNTSIFHAVNHYGHYLVAQVIATGCVFMHNFFVSKYWVFSNKEDPQ